MIESWIWVTILSMVMLISSFLAGNIPLAFKLSEDRLKLTSALGAGLLVGTALIVIIPEGMETVYSIPHQHQTHDIALHNSHPGHVRREANWADARGVESVRWPESQQHQQQQQEQDQQNNNDVEKGEESESISSMKNRDAGSGTIRLTRVRKDSKEDGETLSKEESGPNEKLVRDVEHTNKQEGGEHPKDFDQDPDFDHHFATTGGETVGHRYIGLALISGFIVMFLIDQIDTHSHSHVAVADFMELPLRPNSASSENGGTDLSSHSRRSGTATASTKKPSATIGLVVHAAADGIALGASAQQPALSIIVFLAIMLHKAPAAFGLCTVLLAEGFTRRQIRRHLTAFSLAAPVAAMITFILLQISDAISEMQWWTGILLLFSGGTFLYVSVHVMSGVTSGGNLPRSNLIAMVGGMLLPLLLSVDHGH
ncbi:uncharacterized protein VTP21DRAFT_2204 [Calcarisporiella thermophila]|uniref:uncharacterized protein n=1 Tax=Calcarisporiella thermophila TaxID=911321 RepID=UPI003743B569